MQKRNEAFSRILIDKLLEKSGWDLTDPHQVRFESSGSSGRADYLLMGHHGVLCVLEAKPPHCDPYDAKEQARKYAEETRAPFIVLSNGKEHWFWNYQLQSKRDAYRIERLPSKDDLEWLRQRNLNPPSPLSHPLTSRP
jgi:predicted type IV restriction endonuclease